MTHAQRYPAADCSTQWWSGGRYGGAIMPKVNVLVVHTTEGGTWPPYDGGSIAPTWTLYPDTKAQRVYVRQHFLANESARALENRAGGVQTNSLNIAQVELVGTCVKSGPGYYWPDADDWALQGVADLLRWLHTEWEVPLTSGLTWLPYPASYGSSGGQRMSFDAWGNFTGVCGHQHVPENAHGDPGQLPIARLLTLAAGASRIRPTSAAGDGPSTTTPTTSAGTTSPSPHHRGETPMIIRCGTSTAILSGPIFVGITTKGELDSANIAIAKGMPELWVEKATWDDLDRRSKAVTVPAVPTVKN